MANWDEEVDKQHKWINSHGGTLLGYIERYGNPNLGYCYGDGGTAIFKADSAHLINLEAIRQHINAREASLKCMPEWVVEQLREIRSKAAFENASFGMPADIVTIRGGKEYNKDEFIKVETRLYRQTWLLPLIDELINWAEGI